MKQRNYPRRRRFCPNLFRGRRRQSGQSMTEYILVLVAVVGALLFIMGRLKESKFFYRKFTEPLVKHMAYNYKYADPSGQGWDEGNPNMHLQIQEPKANNFRLFQAGQR